jgi:ribokinase
MQPVITVVGSANVDYIMKVDHLPGVGESVLGGEYLQTFGGKGANQAVAAARAGGAVGFVACLGSDGCAEQMRTNFERDGIDTTSIRLLDGVASGSALVMIDARGDNYLTVASGANYRLTPDRVLAEEARIAASAMVVLQMEIPPESNAEALRLARRHGVPVLCNYAPASAPVLPLDAAIAGLVVNEVEAAQLLGRSVDAANAEAAASELRARGPRWVVLTLGAAGAVVAEAGGATVVPAFPVRPLDATAAGDTFCGALAVALVEGRPLQDAARFASAAAALAVMRLGAQPSIPQRREIDAFLASHRERT